ncbi:uncharacterized protein N0V89_005437 [Didymosphaeria variabile]|uniref:Uncharacterized protein n=1 Tax=Didymosphaeria variabile TaxID=1932322 RepID=A0A9W9CB76_9PLEO|nr:uncharacterized protein N0V89_005437 [Didymosphaeria variabile]KAJ4353707.1 hypothetical protein N0V89_005437 [Didymosphaeria variabile]
MALSPAAPDGGIMTGEPPGKPADLKNFHNYAVCLARHNAWKFFKLLLSVYTRAKRSIGDPLKCYPTKSRGHILGHLGWKLERMCAANTDFSSSDRLTAYIDYVAATRHEMRSLPEMRDHNLIRCLFCNLIKYDDAALDANNGTVPMDIDPRKDSFMYDQADDAMDVDEFPATPSSQPQPNTPLDFDGTGTAGSSATEVAAPREDTPMEIDWVGTSIVEETQEPTGAPGSSHNDATEHGAAGSSAKVSGPARATQAPVMVRTRKSGKDRVEEAYSKERQNGMDFTFRNREFLDDSVPNGDRTNLLQRILSTLKQENDGWTKRHGSLGITDWRLELWAQTMEDGVAKGADENHPDPESFMPTEITDKKVYDRGVRGIIAKMQDPLAFFKSTVRRFKKEVSFVEDDKPVVVMKSSVNRNLPPRPSALRDDTVFNKGATRTLDMAFDRRDVVQSARKRSCLKCT